MKRSCHSTWTLVECTDSLSSCNVLISTFLKPSGKDEVNLCHRLLLHSSDGHVQLYVSIMQCPSACLTACNHIYIIIKCTLCVHPFMKTKHTEQLNFARDLVFSNDSLHKTLRHPYLCSVGLADTRLSPCYLWMIIAYRKCYFSLEHSRLCDE